MHLKGAPGPHLYDPSSFGAELGRQIAGGAFPGPPLPTRQPSPLPAARPGLKLPQQAFMHEAPADAVPSPMSLFNASHGFQNPWASLDSAHDVLPALGQGYAGSDLLMGMGPHSAGTEVLGGADVALAHLA